MRKAAFRLIASGVMTTTLALGLTITAVTAANAAAAAPPASTSVAATHAARHHPPCPTIKRVCNRTVAGQSYGNPSLNIRNGPGTGYAWVGSMPYLTWGTVYCYGVGTNVNGNDYWDYIDYNGTWGYVSDYFLYTGGNINSQVSACN
jgi:hypothetical protein